MRFVSLYGRYAIQLRPQISEVFASGDVRVTQEGLYASFEPGDLRDHEREAAIARFQFRGRFQERDEFTPVDPDYRLSVFDTDKTARDQNWTLEVKTEVESRLINSQYHGSDFIYVPDLELVPPWPRYDGYRGSVANLVKKLVDEGHDLQATLAYERDMQNRPEVIEAIEAALAVPEEQREEEVLA